MAQTNSSNTTKKKAKKTEAATQSNTAKTETTAQPSTAQSLLSYGVKPYVPEKNEEYMSKTQLDHFRNLLNLWKNALLKGGDEAISDLKELAEVPADISDQATLEETFALRLRARDREHKLINKIDESIKLIDSGDYGYCEECGIEIGIRRLEARPTATLCIDCKTLAEVREKQGR
jgi:DnaK suppressor protein